MQEIIFHSVFHTLIDTLKTLPILFLTYLFIEWLEHRVNFSRFMNQKTSRFGPFIGALCGLIPQCGFSAASASLFSEKMISASTLIAIFISTSDEAIPLLLSDTATIKFIPLLIMIKFIMAFFAGYLLKYTIFKEKTPVPEHHCHCHPIHNNTHKEHSHDDNHHHENHGDKNCNCCCNNSSMLLSSLLHTLKISVFIFVTMLVINLAIELIGENTLSQFMLSESLFQPLLTSIIGLLPGCAGSVLITELFINGSISLGSLISGLSAGCGFGYLILFKECKDKKQAFKILFTTFIISVIFGIIIHFAGRI